MNGRIRVGRRGRRGCPFVRDARRWGIGLLAAALLGVSGPVRGQDNASDTTEAPSSGAVTGVHPVRPGDRLSARFIGIGEIACRVAAMSG